MTRHRTIERPRDQSLSYKTTGSHEAQLQRDHWELGHGEPPDLDMLTFGLDSNAEALPCPIGGREGARAALLSRGGPTGGAEPTPVTTRPGDEMRGFVGGSSPHIPLGAGHFG